MSGADIRDILLLLLVFGAVAGLALWAMLALSSVPLRERLKSFTGAAEMMPAPGQGEWIEKVARVAEPFSRLSLPEDGWEQSLLRTRFMNAGWRQPAAPKLYFAAKSLLALALPALVATLAGRSGHLLLVLFASAAIGYYLPNGVLARRAQLRQRDIFESLPDALDLLTICVEAGLSMERALAKVAGEIHIKSVALAQELQLVLMEMRSGFSKERALRNLALRSGVEDVDALVAMLVQAERFGTSMGDSLRVHADNLRRKRAVVAQEAAAKVALKLLFPLIFCIFPALMIVLLGPASIQMKAVFHPVAQSAR
ncbi:type II secretion system F family protein [Duganella sp. Root198D2]|uniref:type II secretion system F family protein n=1 Tax=Duganella sp. Root198D2 TaxID=1736489 RepID=UPI00070F239A|nr:type II secretion system F family protein [Duganella sp. Root198D2]KRC02531.1 type II secretion system protein [Duganella sp. Root198D2]